MGLDRTVKDLERRALLEQLKAARAEEVREMWIAMMTTGCKHTMSRVAAMIGEDGEAMAHMSGFDLGGGSDCIFRYKPGKGSRYFLSMELIKPLAERLKGNHHRPRDTPADVSRRQVALRMLFEAENYVIFGADAPLDLAKK